MEVRYYDVEAEGETDLSFEVKTAKFEDRQEALAFARRCWFSDGELALDQDWIDALSLEDQAEIFIYTDEGLSE